MSNETYEYICQKRQIHLSKKTRHVYMAKETYAHVKRDAGIQQRDSHVTRTDEGLERCQKRHMYIYFKGDVHTSQKR